MDLRRLEDAWPVDEPPRDFAERVTARALAERRPAPRRRARIWLAAVAVAAAAALVFALSSERGMGSGGHEALARTELSLGARARVVLEAGAKLRWSDDVVTQSEGEIFYRVEPGARFVVKTPAGDVSVLGTCFRVRVGTATAKGDGEVKRRELGMAAGGAALAALAVITVYEGKVQLSHASGRVTLAAGEAGKLGPDGAKKLDPTELASAEKSLEERPSGLAQANENLASDIADLNRRLKSVEKEKGKLESELADAERALALRADGGKPRSRHEFDLDQDDWTELAKDGTIKYRHPCFKPNGWNPDAEKIAELGIAPDDVPAIDAAYKRSYERTWKSIRPLCAKAIGNPEVADVLGPDTCTHVVVDTLRRQDGSGVSEAMRQVAEVRAGQRPAPSGKDVHPVYELFWTLTGAMSAFETDLAESLGPEEAKRLAYSKHLCAGHSTFGGPGPRSK